MTSVLKNSGNNNCVEFTETCFSEEIINTLHNNYAVYYDYTCTFTNDSCINRKLYLYLITHMTTLFCYMLDCRSGSVCIIIIGKNYLDASTCSCHVLPFTTNCDFHSFPRNTCWYVNVLIFMIASCIYYHHHVLFYCTTVTLTSSVDRVCPGDTVVFTCVTDTTTLVWSTNGTSQIYFTPLNQVNQAAHTLGIFSLQFLATTGGFKSTATVHNVSLYQNGANITCSDNANDESGSKTRSIMIREPHPNFVMYYIMKVMHNPQKQSHLHPSN